MIINHYLVTFSHNSISRSPRRRSGFFLYTTNWNNFDARLLKIYCRHLKVKNSESVVIVVRFIGLLLSQVFAV